MPHQIVKSVDLPNGGKITVTVTSDERIRAADYFILRPDAMQEMGAVLTSLADSMKPADQ